MPYKICKYCKQEFYNKHSVQEYCNRDCYKNHVGKLDEVKKLIPNKYKSTQIKDFKSTNGVLRKHKKDFENKIIDYPDAPHEKAYIGIAKRPLMKSEGYGYQGVLLQDETRRYVQCHGCGKWAKVITNSHTKKCQNITVNEYKERYGLDKGKGLVSDESSLRLTKAALKNKQCKKEKDRLREMGRKYTNNTGRKASMQQRNNYGTCPKQLKARLYDFIICNREFPNEGNRGKSLYKAIRRHYKSFGEALRIFGLPKLKRQGTRYVFTYPDHTIEHFNINRFNEREMMFESLIEKCKHLRKLLT